MAVEVVNLSDPQQVSTFSHGRFELFSIGGQQIGRAVYEPGWRWSEHIGPTAGTPLCEVEHIGLVLSGRVAVKMADGTEFVLGPGDFFSIPPGHDSWVVGEEDYISLHLLGAGQYSQSADSGTSPD
jgi:quercetin dioxygenase-like cupin family protein